MSMKTFAERLRSARDKKGYSCAELDEVADLTLGHTASIEAGRIESPSISTASKLAIALGIDLTWLVSGGRSRVG
jgi:ribosome-binding protein aMBF1 (putative translation factor)